MVTLEGRLDVLLAMSREAGRLACEAARLMSPTARLRARFLAALPVEESAP